MTGQQSSEGAAVATRDGAGARRALDGVRVLDLSQVAIGPYTTLLLVSLGAQVIKIESNRRPDITRGPRVPGGEVQMQQYPGGEAGERPWNRAAYFNQRNRGKLGATLDFSDPRGRDVLLRLAAKSDVLVENYRASVMERQGMGWDALRAANPRLVYLKMSSQGATGPQRDYGSLGSTLEQTAGLASITGYTDGVPLMTNETYPDPAGAIIGVGAVIAALRRVRQTGEGQFIDLSQRELTASILGEAMMDYALNGRVQGPIGNRHPTAAPHGVYPCIGEDAWVAIAVETYEQWRGLVRAMGSPAWSEDARFATAEGRWQAQAEIDAKLGEWTMGYQHTTLTTLLQAHAVPAGAVLNGSELLADPQLQARGWWEQVTPPEIGRAYPFVGQPWRMSGSPPQPSTPAPTLGQHNDEVFQEIAGLSATEYDELQHAGIISTEPLW